jgi:hypothetical protein
MAPSAPSASCGCVLRLNMALHVEVWCAHSHGLRGAFGGCSITAQRHGAGAHACACKIARAHSLCANACASHAGRLLTAAAAAACPCRCTRCGRRRCCCCCRHRRCYDPAAAATLPLLATALLAQHLGGEAYRRCPMCFDAVSRDRLAGAVLHARRPPRPGRPATFVLLLRDKVRRSFSLYFLRRQLLVTAANVGLCFVECIPSRMLRGRRWTAVVAADALASLISARAHTRDKVRRLRAGVACHGGRGWARCSFPCRGRRGVVSPCLPCVRKRKTCAGRGAGARRVRTCVYGHS